jgi:hypothetical protein
MCTAQQGAMGGISSGVAAPAQYDAQKRPITAGGFVSKGTVVFEDIAKQAGLTSWSHKMGAPEKNFIVETNGSGVALLDYDNDGWLDIYLVNGSTFDALDGKEEPPHAALFHNNHDGTFTNVALQAGVTNDRWGYGVSVADYDNDGWPDIFIGNYGKNRLYHNNRNGTFTDVAEKAGVTLGNWSSGSAWGDYDGDGFLDLYVAGYVHFDRDNLPISGSKAMGSASCQYRGDIVNCGPRGLKGEPDHLFHNNGDGTFSDVTAKAGVEDKDRYYGFTSIFIDLKGNGKPDLVVGNDSTPNYLYINKGNGTFEDDSYLSGFALNNDGREIASMGIAVGDYENNGQVDFFVSDFGDDYKVLFHNDAWRSLPSPLSAGATALSTSTTTDGSICSWRPATSIPRWTSTTGEPPSPSGPCCFATSPMEPRSGASSNWSQRSKAPVSRSLFPRAERHSATCSTTEKSTWSSIAWTARLCCCAM